MDGLIQSALAHHRPRKVGNCAVSLLIEEVAPATETLTDQKADHNYIQNRKKAHFLYFRDDKTSRDSADYAAVNRQAALMNIENFDRMGKIIVPLKNAEVQSRADYSGYYTDENAVHQLVEIELETRSRLVSIENSEHKSRGNNQTVPIDLERAERESDTVDVKLPAEVWELNVKYFHITPPYRDSLPRRECSCRRRAFRTVCRSLPQRWFPRPRQYKQKARCR